MHESISRREFHKLTSAALSGMMAGTLVGCSSGGKEAQAAPEMHACRGLNSCKGQGADKQNACAGQGACALVKHDCGGKNECKNQGGCAPAPGANDCKGKGGCGVPMGGDMWQKAREGFEQRMKEQGKTVGAAPTPKDA